VKVNLMVMKWGDRLSFAVEAYRGRCALNGGWPSSLHRGIRDTAKAQLETCV
jgi:hypothetical protein